MIVVDTSALIAIVMEEAEADACSSALEAESEVLISAGTVAESLIVARRKDAREKMNRLLDELGFEIVTVTPASARRVAQAYDQWGKGVHRAGLNFGDCFAYALAKERSCPLLFVGKDFSKTDIAGVL
jgi:ribonuclease VapC